MYNQGIQIYILTSNRPDYLKATIESVIKSGIELNNIIISDNSTNELTNQLLLRNYSNIKYIRRQKYYSPIQHLNLILNESSYQYLMMFHDDDLLMPNCINEILNVYLQYPHLSAVGINSFIISDNIINNKISFFKSKSKYEFFSSKNDLLKRYASFLPRNIAPFPGYVYNMSKIKGIMFNENIAGRCSDVPFLFDILDIGQIVWISKPFMYYREHESNGAKKITNTDLIGLIKYFESIKLNNKIINKLRVKYLYCILKNKNNINLMKKIAIAASLIKLLFVCLVTDKSSINELITKINNFMVKKYN